MLLTLTSKLRGFGYDAAEKSPTRKQRKTDLRPETGVLDRKRREQVVSNARELRRNFAVAGWAIRTHVAHVAQQSFQARTDDPDFNAAFEDRMRVQSLPENADAAGRHDLDDLIRLAETAAVTDGDCWVETDPADGKTQIIEGDRVESPKDLADDLAAQTVQGVQIDNVGAAEQVYVGRRNAKGKLENLEPVEASRLIQHGYFDRPGQVRGVSPIIASLNTFNDIADANNYALAKAKMAQYLALVHKHGEDWEGLEDGDATLSLGKGPAMAHIHHDEELTLQTADTPGQSFQQYMPLMLMVALKALDLDFSFFDSSHTNYSGSRMALQLYQRSASARVRACSRLRDRITRTYLDLFVDDGLKLPAGLAVEQVRWDWVPCGLPWIDPLKEIKAHAAAIAAGLDSRQNVCRGRQLEWRTIADQLREEQDYLEGDGDQSPVTVANLADLARLVTALPEETDNTRQEAA